MLSERGIEVRKAEPRIVKPCAKLGPGRRVSAWVNRYDVDLASRQSRILRECRLDASRRDTAPEGSPREHYEAMRLVAATGHAPADQHACIGCSIKWRESDA